MSKKIILTLIFEWNMAHRLPGHESDKNIHGHRYKLEIEISGRLNQKTGLIVDFGDIKKLVNYEILEPLDNCLVFYKKDKVIMKLIGDNKSLKHLAMSTLPSTENLILWIYDKLKKPIKKIGINIVQLRLWESEKCSVILKV